MTLHDRIMAILDGPYSGDDSWNDGYVAAVEEAADIATEAGELMSSLAAALGECQDTLDSSINSDEAEYAQTVLDEYRRWRGKE